MLKAGRVAGHQTRQAWALPAYGSSWNAHLACLYRLYLAVAGGGWITMAELDSVNGFPHSYMITCPTHQPYGG